MDENNSHGSEIPPKEIFEIMKTNIYDNFYNYSYSSINKDYLSSRKNLFNILHKITIKMGFKSQTFFLCAHFMDIIFTRKRRINSNLNTLGLASLCLAAKYCENDPIVPHLQYFIRIFNSIMGYKNIISMSDLMRTEVIVLKLLNYKLNYYTIYDFNSFLFGHGILKIEQLKDLENKNKRYYLGRRKEFTFNHNNSILIKNILEKIYKKSRYYLDIIIKDTKLCFKYNPLYLSIYIMKKSVEEVLNNEYNCDKKEQEEYKAKNNLCFKQIMYDFYKINYEINEQYREILSDDEITEIFEPKEKNEEGPAPSADKKFPLKDDEKEKNNKNDLNSVLKIDEEIERRSVYNNSVSNGFYNRLKLKSNLEDLNKKKQNERMVLSSRKENTDLNKINSNYNYNSNYNKNNNYDNDDEIDLDSNLNINEIQKSFRAKEDKKEKRWEYQNSYKKDESLSSNNNNSLVQNKFVITSNNRYMARPDVYNSIRNSNTIHKTYLNNNNYNLTYTINSNRGNKILLNKNTDVKVDKNSPLKMDGISNNYNGYMDRYVRLKGLNTGTERNEYTYNILDNNNSILSNNVSTGIKRFEKKPYYRKLIHQNTNDNLSSINRTGVSSYFYSNNFKSQVDRNKIENNNEMNSLNRNKVGINNKDRISSNINTFYSRIRIKNRKNENNDLTNKSIDVSEDTHNNIDLKQQIITTTSSRYRRRYYNSNINKNNDISSEISNPNALIVKDNNKRVIESYGQSNSNTNSNNTFYKLPTTSNIFRRKNKILSVNSSTSINQNNSNINDTSDIKNVTSHNFFRNNTNFTKINVNTSRASDNVNSEMNKSYAPSKRISYVLAKKNSELNNTLKEINKTRAKNMEDRRFEKFSSRNNEIKNIREREKEISVNTINTVSTINSNNDSKKVYQSIRQKYLNLNKNRNSNINDNSMTNSINIGDTVNINKNNKTLSDFNKRESNSSVNINLGKSSISGYANNSIRGRYSFKNKNDYEYNNINNSSVNNNNNNQTSSRVSEIENKNKNNNITESSIYKFLNKTKTLFKRSIIKEDDSNKTNRNININDTNNTTSSNSFYKTQQNFYKNSNRNDVNQNLQKDYNKKESQQSSNLGNAYLRSIINKNKLNKDNPNSQSQKNSSTIVINNNININIGNKNNNISNEYVKYKNIYKKNSNIPDLNLNNSLLKQNNNSQICKSNSNRSMKSNDTSNTASTGSTFSNLLHRFPFYRKTIDKSNNNNLNNNTNIENPNGNNRSEKYQFFHRK